MTRRAEVYKLNTISKHFFSHHMLCFFIKYVITCCLTLKKLSYMMRAQKKTNIYFPETKHRGMHLTIFHDILNLYFA